MLSKPADAKHLLGNSLEVDSLASILQWITHTPPCVHCFNPRTACRQKPLQSPAAATADTASSSEADCTVQSAAGGADGAGKQAQEVQEGKEEAQITPEQRTACEQLLAACTVPTATVEGLRAAVAAVRAAGVPLAAATDNYGRNMLHLLATGAKLWWVAGPAWDDIQPAWHPVSDIW